MNIGLLTGERLPDFRLSTLKPILEDPAFAIRLAIMDVRPAKSTKAKLIKNFRRGRGGYMVVMALKRFFRKKENNLPVKQFCGQHGIAVIETSHPYAPSTLARIQEYQLDVLLLIGGFGIVGESLIKITPLGILSYHHGDMRKYRGMPPALWELYHNEAQMGVTVQLLAPGLDCGTPIEEKTVVIYPNDNLQQLEKRALQESADMMHLALQKLADPNFMPACIAHFGQVYTLPNLRQWISLQCRICWRKVKYAALAQ
jgi:methionyl-tRNA formyltransferase